MWVLKRQRNGNGDMRMNVRRLMKTWFVVGACSALPASASPGTRRRASDGGPTVWRTCASQLGAPPEAIQAMARWSVLRSNDDLVWLAALITVESQWKANSLSATGASGPMQLMPDGAAEGAEECHIPIPQGYQLEEWDTAIRVGSCLLRYDLRQVGGDWLYALVLYNGGWRQLLRLQNTGHIVSETDEYVKQVKYLHKGCL